MANKEPVSWITVHGARVPIFADGSVGGPKALREAAKKQIEKNKEANKNFAKKYAKMTDPDDPKYQPGQKTEKDKEMEKLAKEADEDSKQWWADRKAKKEAEKKDTDNKAKSSKPSHYSDSQLKDEEFRKSALKEMKRYEENWNGMSAQDRKNVGTLKEVRERIKELENYEKQSKSSADNKISKQINKDLDTKEKQIAQRKAEVDKLNGNDTKVTNDSKAKQAHEKDRDNKKDNRNKLPQHINTTINPEHKVSYAKVKKEIDDYPVGTYLKYSTKGNINDVGPNTYGMVKVGPNHWVSYGSLTGYGSTRMTSQDIKDKMYQRKVKNIGVKLP